MKIILYIYLVITRLFVKIMFKEVDNLNENEVNEYWSYLTKVWCYIQHYLKKFDRKSTYYMFISKICEYIDIHENSCMLRDDYLKYGNSSYCLIDVIDEDQVF